MDPEKQRELVFSAVSCERVHVVCVWLFPLQKKKCVYDFFLHIWYEFVFLCVYVYACESVKGARLSLVLAHLQRNHSVMEIVEMCSFHSPCRLH